MRIITWPSHIANRPYWCRFEYIVFFDKKASTLAEPSESLDDSLLARFNWVDVEFSKTFAKCVYWY